MLECLRFILKCVVDFIAMLFRIDVGFTNLGTVMCICYILLPMLLVIVNFLKVTLLEEFDESYDEKRPRETWSSTEHQWLRTPGSTKEAGSVFSTYHTRSRSRRYKL